MTTPKKKTAKKAAAKTGFDLFAPLEARIVDELIIPILIDLINNGDCQDLTDLLAVFRQETGINANVKQLERWLADADLETKTVLVWRSAGELWSHERLPDAPSDVPSPEDPLAGMTIRGAGADDDVPPPPRSSVDLSPVLQGLAARDPSGRTGVPGSTPSGDFSMAPLPRPQP